MRLPMVINLGDEFELTYYYNKFCHDFHQSALDLQNQRFKTANCLIANRFNDLLCVIDDKQLMVCAHGWQYF